MFYFPATPDECATNSMLLLHIPQYQARRAKRRQTVCELQTHEQRHSFGDLGAKPRMLQRCLVCFATAGQHRRIATGAQSCHPTTRRATDACKMVRQHKNRRQGPEHCTWTHFTAHNKMLSWRVGAVSCQIGHYNVFAGDCRTCSTWKPSDEMPPVGKTCASSGETVRLRWKPRASGGEAFHLNWHNLGPQVAKPCTSSGEALHLKWRNLAPQVAKPCTSSGHTLHLRLRNLAHLKWRNLAP